MRASLLALLLCALPASARDPALLEALGVERTGAAWDWRPYDGRPPVRLSPEEGARLEAFLRSLPEAGREAALAEPLLGELRRRGLPSGASPWLLPDGAPSPAGLRALPGLAAGRAPPEPAPWLAPPAPSLPRDVGRDPVPLPPAPESPAGPLPVDRAGTGRGYVLAGEGAGVLAPGRVRSEVQLEAANHLYARFGEGWELSQRFQTHTAAFGLRAGLRVPGLPPLELGGSLRAHENGEPWLDDFILSVERAFDAVYRYRTGPDEIRRGFRLVRDGAVLADRGGRESGLGDLGLTAKALLFDGPSGGGTRLALRVSANLATGLPAFTRGNYAGLGLSLEQRLAGWLWLHGDLRAAVLLDARDALGLPLRPATAGGTTAVEFRPWEGGSIVLQHDLHSSPYRPTGVDGFDMANAALSFGLAQRVRLGERTLRATLYGRENLKAPFNFAANLDPDFSTGVLLELEGS